MTFELWILVLFLIAIFGWKALSIYRENLAAKRYRAARAAETLAEEERKNRDRAYAELMARQQRRREIFSVPDYIGAGRSNRRVNERPSRAPVERRISQSNDMQQVSVMPFYGDDSATQVVPFESFRSGGGGDFGGGGASASWSAPCPSPDTSSSYSDSGSCSSSDSSSSSSSD